VNPLFEEAEQVTRSVEETRTVARAETITFLRGLERCLSTLGTLRGLPNLAPGRQRRFRGIQVRARSFAAPLREGAFEASLVFDEHARLILAWISPGMGAVTREALDGDLLVEDVMPAARAAVEALRLHVERSRAARERYEEAASLARRLNEALAA